jgi:hypothetical protein
MEDKKQDHGHVAEGNIINRPEKTATHGKKDIDDKKIKYRNITIRKKILLGALVTIAIIWIISNVLSLMELRDLGKDGIIQKSRAITIMGEAMRQYQSENWDRGVF